MKNIDTAFRYLRRMCLLIIVCCFLFTGFISYKSYQTIEAGRQKIYVLANNKAVEAYASDRKDNIPVEAKDHIRSFHHYFFTLDPDDKSIQAHLVRALYLADGSARKTYENLRESGYYAQVIAANISQRITVDSIRLDMDQQPFYFRCFATQKIIRTTSIVTRNLVTEGYLRNVSRSENNSHGFLVERWSIIENKDLKIEKR